MLKKVAAFVLLAVALVMVSYRLGRESVSEEYADKFNSRDYAHIDWRPDHKAIITADDGYRTYVLMVPVEEKYDHFTNLTKVYACYTGDGYNLEIIKGLARAQCAVDVEGKDRVRDEVLLSSATPTPREDSQ